jgi:hypothetical protein
VSTRVDRSSWPVRRFALGHEPSDDLTSTTTAEQRVAMVWDLTLEAWAVSGREMPAYTRAETPVTTRRAARR